VIVPLTARELEQAIIAPAERVGLRLEAGLLPTILNDLAEQPGMLPLLQYALTELYQRREGLTLTLAAYQAMGGVLGALAHLSFHLAAGLHFHAALPSVPREEMDQLQSLPDHAHQRHLAWSVMELRVLGRGPWRHACDS
jgi:hypothetical protein